MGFTIYYCWNGDKMQVESESHYNYYENWISNINDPTCCAVIDVDKESQEAWLDLGDMWLSVLVTVSKCDSGGSIVDDLGYLYSKDGITDYNEALRCYHSINLTPAQEEELWLYLSKWISKDEGLYLTYEIIDNDGTCDAYEAVSLGHNAD